MGRRKIEIKGIKDDRNRSVTFLKRKGGLFKKAHELSVLCSVDVAVVIFGQNRKLYEFSSGDINHTLARYQHYGMPHEHKGPADFADKGGGDDDDEDDDAAGSPPPENVSPPHHGIMPHPIQDQPRYHHTPPMTNGGVYHPRMPTPQPNDGSRPSSRTSHIRRQSSNLNPHQHQHPQASQPMMQNPTYSYQTMPSMYQQQQPAATASMHPGHQQGTPPMSHHNYTHPLPQQNHAQNLYMQDQRRSSMPPTFPGHTQVGQSEQQNAYHTPPQHHQRHPFQSPPLPEPQHPLPQTNQSNVYYQSNNTFQHDPSRHPQPPFKMENQTQDSYANSGHQSVDMGHATRDNGDGRHTPSHFNAPPAPPTRPARTASSSVAPNAAATPASRVNSMQSSDAKRPRLTVQIPGEASDGNGSGVSVSSDTSPKDPPKTSALTPAKNTSDSGTNSSGIVLPAPSPRSTSAGAILSAGATGPSNPFARPNVPSKHAGNIDAFKENMASPMSALPSRVMAENGFMSSPSSMFPELGFGGGGNNLASPAVYQPTPITMHGPSWKDAAPAPAPTSTAAPAPTTAGVVAVDEKKRKSPDADATVAGASKKAKT
ncbi:MAG: hypothetical protein M1828_005380 [Chrysothrix sp. TS-e1954]|nr:MAG: hypothetical protein M1828_005380 [Chrysothrix sp. TS-e1954]